ncbi:MAG: histidine--tRNA ligase [Candidatus Marinimicrobia bacterium]|nr:histidine--tRNA ligase [Candidatus Neomarinimicrobiota bacterium]
MGTNEGQPLQGMVDLTEPELARWRWFERHAQDVLGRYQVAEIRTPLLERAALFEHAVGEGTDVVQKEMYRLTDRGGRELALRPEGTAGVMRHLAGRGPEAEQARLYYLGPMFRAERPQAGRRRQFHQLGVELLGAPRPRADAECLALQWALLEKLNLPQLEFQINTRGAPADQPRVAAGYRAALEPRQGDLCADCRRRLATNVLRVLDCKQPGCQALGADLPPVVELLGAESQAYFEAVQQGLTALGVPYRVAPKLVRGLDYYAHTVWEVTAGGLGAQNALSGGGRYRIRVGARDLEGVGFAIGLERLLAAWEEAGGERPAPRPPALWLAALSPEAESEQLALAVRLRRVGLSCGLDLRGRSLKAQLRAANQAAARWVLVRGPDELADGTYVLKDLRTGEQSVLDEVGWLAHQRALTAREIV